MIDSSRWLDRSDQIRSSDSCVCPSVQFVVYNFRVCNCLFLGGELLLLMSPVVTIIYCCPVKTPLISLLKSCFLPKKLDCPEPGTSQWSSLHHGVWKIRNNSLLWFIENKAGQDINRIEKIGFSLLYMFRSWDSKYLPNSSYR